MFVQGGMRPLQAIRNATVNGASYLGMAKRLGHWRPGSLADLIIMDDNPLDDIRNCEKIKYVMINGRLYDSLTMNEVGSREKLRTKLWFETDRGMAFTIPYKLSETWTFTVPNCD